MQKGVASLVHERGQTDFRLAFFEYSQQGRLVLGLNGLEALQVEFFCLLLNEACLLQFFECAVLVRAPRLNLRLVNQQVGHLSFFVLHRQVESSLLEIRLSTQIG